MISKLGVYTFSATAIWLRKQLVNGVTGLVFAGPLGSVVSVQRAILLPHTVTYFFADKQLLKVWFAMLCSAWRETVTWTCLALQIQGIGFKAFCPKMFNYTSLVLRMGFGGTELAFRVWPNLRVRSRKQKLVVVGMSKQQTTAFTRALVELKYPGVYTGKGIRLRGQSVVLKKRKQQQRSK